MKKKYDWILIDDDDLTHKTWEVASKENNKTFIGFKTSEEFDSHKSSLDQNSSIFIDSNLSNGIKGEDVAKKLFAEGFINLYLATGYSPDQFPAMAFIKAIVGKEPPG